MSNMCPVCGNRGLGTLKLVMQRRQGGKNNVSERWLCQCCKTRWLYVLYTPKGSYEAYERTEIRYRGKMPTLP